MFFALSAYLFGEIWKKGGQKPFAIKEFAKKRFLRIYLPLWLSLLLAFPIDWYVKGELDTTTLAANIVGLNWLRPLQTGGHLWYITMLLVLYVCFVVSSRLKLERWAMRAFVIALLVVVGLMAVIEQRIGSVSKALPLIAVSLAALMFYKGREACSWAGNHRSMSWVATTVLLIGALSLFYIGWWEAHKAMVIVAYTIAGFALFVTIAGCLKVDSISPVTSHFANISYEIYLVHLPIIELLLRMIDNKITILVLWLVLTYIGAYAIRKVESLRI